MVTNVAQLISQSGLQVITKILYWKVRHLQKSRPPIQKKARQPDFIQRVVSSSTRVNNETRRKSCLLSFPCCSAQIYLSAVVVVWYIVRRAIAACASGFSVCVSQMLISQQQYLSALLSRRQQYYTSVMHGASSIGMNELSFFSKFATSATALISAAAHWTRKP